RSWDDFWDASTSTMLGEAKTRLPDPADVLLHVFVHGSQRRVESSVQWVADAATVIRGATLDWDRLVRQAQRRHAVLPALEMLTYLSRRFSVDVPAAALAQLR